MENDNEEIKEIKNDTLCKCGNVFSIEWCHCDNPETEILKTT